MDIRHSKEWKRTARMMAQVREEREALEAIARERRQGEAMERIEANATLRRQMQYTYLLRQAEYLMQPVQLGLGKGGR